MKYLLIIICVLLSGLIFYQIRYYSEDVEPQGIDAAVSDHDVVGYEIDEIKSLPEYEEIIERPLFSVNRQAPKLKTQVLDASINVEELERLVFFGIIKSGDIAYAIIGNIDGDQESRQIRAGFNYKGWQVSEISSDSVKFVGDEVEYELSIAPSDLSNGTSLKRTNSNTSSNRQTHTNAPSVNDNKKESTSSSGQGLIYNRSRKTSPIKIPRSNQLGNQKPLSEEQIQEVQEQGGYSFDIDETFDGDYYED